MPALKKHLPTLCLSLGLAATAWQATAAEKGRRDRSGTPAPRYFAE
jgi:hypothetical protein